MYAPAHAAALSQAARGMVRAGSRISFPRIDPISSPPYDIAICAHKPSVPASKVKHRSKWRNEPSTQHRESAGDQHDDPRCQHEGGT